MDETDAVEEDCRSADVALCDARAPLHAHHSTRNMTFNQELVQAVIFVDLLRDCSQALARVRQAEVRWYSLHLTRVSLLFRMVTFTCMYIQFPYQISRRAHVESFMFSTMLTFSYFLAD